jgi:UDP-N-acetylmuramoylalanine--D-glutamate ligase
MRWRRSPACRHRSRWVADVGGVRFVNDSKGTNVGATLAAVIRLERPAGRHRRRRRQGSGLLAICAGVPRQGRARGADPGAPSSKPLLGRLRDRAREDMASAVRRGGLAAARPGHTVLLSPALREPRHVP